MRKPYQLARRSTANALRTNQKIHNHPAASLRWRWMIEGDWKLILPDPQNQPDDAIELYNLSDDPHEERNLADSHSTLVDEMRAKVNAWWAGR